MTLGRVSESFSLIMGNPPEAQSGGGRPQERVRLRRDRRPVSANRISGYETPAYLSMSMGEKHVAGKMKKGAVAAPFFLKAASGDAASVLPHGMVKQETLRRTGFRHGFSNPLCLVGRHHVHVRVAALQLSLVGTFHGYDHCTAFVTPVVFLLNDCHRSPPFLRACAVCVCLVQ
jgi:hypothetical protein